MSRVNCITINTDASFHADHNVGAYAFYIICDCFKLQKGGFFKEPCKTSEEAEMKAIANALYTLLHQKDLPQTKWIIINSDCLRCFKKISKKSQDPTGRLIFSLLRKIRKKCAIGNDLPLYEFRHVKAHSDIKDARSLVNEWCDKEAKKWMRQAVLNKTSNK